MTKPFVLIPFRPDSPERHDALGWVRKQWTDDGYEVGITTDRNESPWCKAAAINHGMHMLAKLSDARVRDGGEAIDRVIIADADCWAVSRTVTTGDQLNQWHDWGTPHRRVVRLSAKVTLDLITGDLRQPTTAWDNLEEPPYTALRAAGGIVVLKREVWDRVPMDPRFLGWGFEDVAWWYALRTLVGVPWKGKADLFHLWHPRSEPMDRTERSINGNPANAELADRYIKALHRPVQMQAIVDEAKAALSAGRSG